MEYTSISLPSYKSDIVEVDPVKERDLALSSLLDKFSILTLTLGSLAMTFSIFRVTHQGWHPSIFIDLAFFGLVVLLLSIRRFLPLRVVYSTLLLLVSMLAIMDYLLFGLAHIGFLTFAVSSSVLGAIFSFKVALISFGCSSFLVACLGVGAYLGLIPIIPLSAGYLNSHQTWLNHITSSAVYTAVMLITLGSVFNRLTEAAKRLMRQSQKLSDNEKRYRLLAENMREVVFVQDMDFNLTYISPSAQRFFGYTPEELKVKWLKDVMTPLSYATAMDVFSKFPTNITGQQNFDMPIMEFDFVRQDGSVFVGEIQPVLVRNNKGDLVGWQAILRDISEKKKAERELLSTVQEKEVLLHELYHRTKNNMQIINSMLDLQASYFTEKRTAEVFKDIQNRIRAMSLVHQKLNQESKLSTINLKEYLSEVSKILVDSYAHETKDISLDLNLASVSVSVDTAIPCGLILNELLVNALKHAFTGKSNGLISVTAIKEEDGQMVLEVCDNGNGMPENLEISKVDSFGLKIIYALAERQLQGTVTYTQKDNMGAQCIISFKDRA
ncbi:MAG: PAS domain S-box protein [Fibrobacteria bacterium]|nr:PAS domain S-box protein [Fibrobacteria bacterium]